jgi:hypothetical protein
MIIETVAPVVALKKTDSIESFIALLGRAGEQLREAAEMLARLVAHDPQALAKIREQSPSIPAGLLTNLLRVGERSLHPDLLLNSCRAYQKLRLLPYSTQEHLLQVGAVDLVINHETGDTLRVPLTELTKPQVAQVFTREGVRSCDDQRAWLKRQQVAYPNQTKADPAAFFVRKDRLIITRACEMSKAQLLAVLAEVVA